MDKVPDSMLDDIYGEVVRLAKTLEPGAECDQLLSPKERAALPDLERAYYDVCTIVNYPKHSRIDKVTDVEKLMSAHHSNGHIFEHACDKSAGKLADILLQLLSE
jgi:hypothetical protein